MNFLLARTGSPRSHREVRAAKASGLTRLHSRAVRARNSADSAVGCHRRRGISGCSVDPFSRHRNSREVMDLDHLKTIPLFSSLSDKALSTVAVFASETSV